MSFRMMSAIRDSINWLDPKGLHLLYIVVAQLSIKWNLKEISFVKEFYLFFGAGLLRKAGTDQKIYLVPSPFHH